MYDYKYEKLSPSLRGTFKQNDEFPNLRTPDNQIYYMYLSITPNLQVSYLYITFLLFGINGLN